PARRLDRRAGRQAVERTKRHEQQGVVADRNNFGGNASVAFADPHEITDRARYASRLGFETDESRQAAISANGRNRRRRAARVEAAGGPSSSAPAELMSAARARRMASAIVRSAPPWPASTRASPGANVASARTSMSRGPIHSVTVSTNAGDTHTVMRLPASWAARTSLMRARSGAGSA